MDNILANLIILVNLLVNSERACFKKSHPELPDVILKEVLLRDDLDLAQDKLMVRLHQQCLKELRGEWRESARQKVLDDACSPAVK